MNARFIEACKAAGYQATSPSTVPGTKKPIVGYQPPD